MTTQLNRDRTQLWLPLLQRLSEVCPSWLVWKNADSAFTGTGDIDSAAPDGEWQNIEREFRAWATQQEIGPAIVCRHIPGGLNLVAVPMDGSTLLEVGVKANKLWRGSILFVLDDLLPLVEWDQRGFRRVRPGAEGLFKLLLNGVRWDGNPNQDGLVSKHVIELLNQGWEIADADTVARRALHYDAVILRELDSPHAFDAVLDTLADGAAMIPDPRVPDDLVSALAAAGVPAETLDPASPGTVEAAARR